MFVGPTRLYLNDVEELVGVLSKVLRDVRIKADGYEVTDPADLPKLGRQIKDFTLSGFDPYVVVSLKPNQVSVACEDGHDALGAGLLAQVEDVLRRRRAALGWLRTWHLTLLSLALLGASFLTPSGVPKALLTWVSLPLFCLIIALMIWATRRDITQRGRVYTSRSGERTGWITRNGDAALIAVVAAVLGSAVGGFLVALVTGVWKP